MGYSLGVDLGTTYTAAATYRDGRTEPVTLGTRSLTMPSVVFLKEDGELLVGEAAERRGATDLGRVARAFKRRLGDPVPIILGGTPYSPQALMGRLLEAVVRLVTEREGEAPALVAVTHPANWGPYKQELLAQAIRLADVPEARTVTEPEAAALHYASATRVEPGDVVAVYDLGGGTFDAAVLRKTTEGFEPLGTPEGIEHLGGVDFDEAVLAFVTSALGDALAGLDPSSPSTLGVLARLRRDCIEAKEALSADADAVVPVQLPTAQTEIRITRTEFEGLIRPALQDTVAAMRRALRSAAVEPAGVKAVVLVGGSSRIPLVSELVHTELGIPAALDTHPKHSVALGAALLAGSVADGVPLTGSSAPPAPPAPAPVAAPPAPAPPVEASVAAPPDLPPPVLPPAGTPPAPPAAPLPAAPPPAAPEPPRPSFPAPGPAPLPESAGAGGSRSRLPLVIGGVVAAAAIAAGVVLLGGGGGEDELGTTPTSAATEGSTTTTTSGDATTTTAGEATTTTASGVSLDLPASEAPAPESEIAFTRNENDQNDVFVIQADGSGERQITLNPANDALPVWSPDRRTIVYTRSSDGVAIRAVSEDGGTERLVSDQVAADARASWSPDGLNLVVVSDVTGQSDLYVLDLATGDLSNLTNDAVIEGDPAWSPDGESIVFWRQDGTNQDLFVVDVDDAFAAVEAGEPFESYGVQLTDQPTLDADPAWSPDGTQIAFASDRAGNWDIYVMDAGGGDATPLTTDPADDQDPAFSPDGSAVAFGSKRDAGDSEIYVMAADGSGQRRLTQHPGFDGHPAWRASQLPR